MIDTAMIAASRIRRSSTVLLAASPADLCQVDKCGVGFTVVSGAHSVMAAPTPRAGLPALWQEPS
jgi:hypothetical protein